MGKFQPVVKRRTVQQTKSDDSEFDIPGTSNRKTEPIAKRRRTRQSNYDNSEINIPGQSIRKAESHSKRKKNRPLGSDESESGLINETAEPITNQRPRAGPGNKKPKRIAKRKKSSQLSSSNDNECNGSETSNQQQALRIGRIERIHLINFMCHANYIVEFNKHINIFVGCNGSGKSAIITAVVIGLGGNAAATERSKNISQLIRRGASSGSIEITLYNDGMDSFENDIYGNRIIVYRQINENGTSQYHIKNEKGKVITKSLRDLRSILMYMNVQVDNPVCVLNQDAARNFLKEASPTKFYKLFQKATQLEKVIGLLDDAAKSFQTSKSNSNVLQRKLEKQKKDYMDTKDHYEHLMSVEVMKQELQNLKIELEWHNVSEEETKYEAISNKLTEVSEKIRELKNSIDNWSEDLNQFNEEKTNIIAELNKTKATIVSHRSTHESLRNSRTELRSQVIKHESKYKDMVDKLKWLEQEIQEMQKSIDDRQTSDRIEILRRENDEQLHILLAEREENRISQENYQTEVQKLDAKVQEAESNLDDLKHKQRETKQNMEKIKREIKEINVKSTNNLSIFGNHMPNLIAVLEQHHANGKFSELPRGPIGRYVQVKNAKWSRLVEHIIGGQLQNFVFNTHEDSKYFDELLKREFPRIKPISKIITKFCHTPHDVGANKVKVPRGTATILLDEIVVSDPVVLNVLIDQNHIETIVMCSGTEEACKYTIENTKVPKNLSKIFSLEPAAEYNPAPNFCSYGINIRPAKFLQTDMKQYKAQLEQELVDATKEFEAVMSELNKFNQFVKRSNDELTKQKASLLNLEKDLRQIQNKIEDIENFEYPAQHEVDVLQNELKELQNDYNTTKKEIENVKQNSQTSKEKVKAIEEDINVNQAEAKKLEKILNDKKKQIDEITEKIDNLEIKNIEADLKRYELAKTKTETEMSNQQTILKQATQKAAENGERINNTRGADKIQSLIKITENKIKKRYASIDDITTVKMLLIERENTYKRSKTVLEELNEILKMATSSREARYFHLYYMLRPSMAVQVKTQFSSTLRSRKFGGKIEIDDDLKLLDIDIIPQDKNIPDAVSNTKSLSGGERSFSTLAFLTSLWSCVSAPFYFLDEYDVFTDEINRRLMAQLLISEAKRQANKQFCFFTPQDMSFVKESDSVAFHRLQNHLNSK